MRFVPLNKNLLVELVDDRPKSDLIPLEMMEKPKFMIALVKESDPKSSFTEGDKIVIRTEGLETITIGVQELYIIQEAFVAGEIHE